MVCGISTACFYPMDTIAALERVAALGAPVAEVFLNTFSEVEEPYLSRLVETQQRLGIRVSSVHPFATELDGFFFSSDYSTRLADGIAKYRREFEACRRLGADKLVFHGGRAQPLIQRVKAGTMQRYAERFCALAAVGAEYGVTLCQENVAYCMMPTVAAAKELAPMLGEHAAFVLDTKQAHRRGEDPAGFLPVLGDNLRQIHLSDFDAGEECLPPGQGDFDTAGFIQKLARAGYTGDVIIEVYSDSYQRDEELAEAMRRVETWIGQTGGNEG